MASSVGNTPYVHLQETSGQAESKFVCCTATKLNIVHKPLLLLTNSALYLVFLAYFSVVQLASPEATPEATTRRYWWFAVVMLVGGYASAAAGIWFFIGFRRLVGRGRASAEEARRVLYLLGVVQSSINSLTASTTFAAVLAINAVLEQTYGLHPTAQHGADLGTFWGFAVSVCAGSVLFIWALQALLLEPLQSRVEALQRAELAAGIDADVDAETAAEADVGGRSGRLRLDSWTGAQSRSTSTSLLDAVRYARLRAQVAVAVARHLFAMTVNTVSYTCAVAFNSAFEKLFWNSAYTTCGPTQKGQKIPGVDQAWCQDVLTASIATFDATRPGCSFGGNGTAVAAGGDDDAGGGGGGGGSGSGSSPSCSADDAPECYRAPCACFGTTSCARGLCECHFAAVDAINAGAAGYAWAFFFGSLVVTLLVVTVKHLRRVYNVKSISTRLRELALDAQRGTRSEPTRAGGHGTASACASARRRAALAALVATRGLWRALMRFIAHTTVWGTACALYAAVITSTALASGLPETIPNPRPTSSSAPGARVPATRAWFLGPAFVPKAQLPEYARLVVPYMIAVTAIGVLLMAGAHAALRRFASAELARSHDAVADSSYLWRPTYYYGMLAFLCECVELASIGLALCIGRAFNALLLTTFRAHGSGSYHIAYPVVCTALAIALSVLATRVYGACPRVVKEAPGQIVPFGDILDLANKARDTQVGVLSGSDASLAVSSQSGSVV